MFLTYWRSGDSLNVLVGENGNTILQLLSIDNFLAQILQQNVAGVGRTWM